MITKLSRFITESNSGIKITYHVGDIYTSKTWSGALKFAKKTDRNTIVVKGRKGAKEVEKAYEIDTWKTPTQIVFDIECEFF